MCMDGVIGLVSIENSSYNWYISTYQDSNTNSMGVFHCIKLINGNGNGKFQCCANTLLLILLSMYKYKYLLSIMILLLKYDIHST